MHRHHRTLIVAAALIASAVAETAPAQFAVPPPPSAEQIAAAPSFAADQRVIASHYFYWYRWPHEHFYDNEKTRDDNQRHHFPDHETVSYASSAWHKRQALDMLDAGIDVALLIYWGTPNNYEKADIAFSVRGIPPLVEALDELAKEGKTLRVGMFFDTSTLLGEHAYRERGAGNVDLRTDAGKELFYRTIRDFFCMLPTRHWACIDGRPIVQLYESAFAAGHDESLLAYVYERFEKDFAGRRPFVVSGPSWAFAGDAVTGWGAALSGPILGPRAAQIGPGYDDSPVNGRTTPTRDRLAGGFYRASWLLALQARPQLVILETWSEMHEGTPICESLEEGRLYIDITREFAGVFKSGAAPKDEQWATALKSVLDAPRSSPLGREHASRLHVSCAATSDGRRTQLGLSLVENVADGVFEIARRDDGPAIRTLPGANPTQYLYFDVADPYYYDHRGDVLLRFEYLDAGRGEIIPQYDSTEQTGRILDRYRDASAVQRSDTGRWATASVRLYRARLANRQNGGADFRLASPGCELLIRRVELSKLPWDYAEREPK